MWRLLRCCPLLQHTAKAHCRSAQRCSGIHWHSAQGSLSAEEPECNSGGNNTPASGTANVREALAVYLQVDWVPFLRRLVPVLGPLRHMMHRPHAKGSLAGRSPAPGPGKAACAAGA